MRTRRCRLVRICVVAVLVIGISGTPAASARPVTNPQCEDSTYRVRHPLICDSVTSTGDPFGVPGSGGGGSDGGLLGTIGRFLGSLTGGLL